MANVLYTKGKEGILDGTIDLNSHDILAILVDGADYTPTLATDSVLADIPILGRVATSSALQTPTCTNGVFDADDITLSAVTGDKFEYIVLIDDTANRLIALIDTASGLPCTPSGADITITWPAGASKIFALT
jgi:hypothetical protein